MINIKKLDGIINEMSLIYVNSLKKLSMSKKMEYYQKSIILIDEATKLFDEIENKISNLDTVALNQTNNLKLENLNNLLYKNGCTFSEASFVIEQLLAMDKNLPKHSEIIDNMEKQGMYEEYDI